MFISLVNHELVHKGKKYAYEQRRQIERINII